MMKQKSVKMFSVTKYLIMYNNHLQIRILIKQSKALTNLVKIMRDTRTIS